MLMSNDKMEIIVDNEREWRLHILRKIDRMEDKFDKMEHDFNFFKIRSFGFIAVLVGLIEVITKYFSRS
jgi:hypothetical protein